MPTIKTYQQARDYLGNKKERPYANNTRIEIDSLDLGHEVITVKYHGNPVVNFFPDGTMTFNSCGWRTITTKERINWFLPDGFTCYQNKSVWYIADRSNGWQNAHIYVFADGIAIKNGQVYNAGNENEQDSIKARIKAVKKYVDGFVSALLAGDVESPSGGDCWYCLMKDEQGNSLENSDHIESHIEESYYVPSLLMNAEKFRGMSILAKDGVARLWNGESLSAWQINILTRDVKSSLTAYLKHELNIAQ